MGDHIEAAQPPPCIESDYGGYPAAGGRRDEFWEPQRVGPPSHMSDGSSGMSATASHADYGSPPGAKPGKMFPHAQRPPRDGRGRRADGNRVGGATQHNPRSKEDRPWRYFEKIQIDNSQFPPNVRPAAVIIGVRGSNHARMQEESKCCVQLRGRGISSPGTPGADEPMHLWVKYDEENQFNKVKAVLDEIIRSCDYGPPQLGRRNAGAAPVGMPGGIPQQLPGGPPKGGEEYHGLSPVVPVGPVRAVEFLYTLHIACHQAAAQVMPDVLGLWIDRLPRTYEEYFGFPFEIDRFLPPVDLRCQALFGYLIEVLSSLTLIVTVGTVSVPRATQSEPVDSDCDTQDFAKNDRAYISAALPPDIPWPEFEKIANEQLHRVSAPSPPFAGRPLDCMMSPQGTNAPFVDAHALQPPMNLMSPGSLEDGDELDLDAILSSIDTPSNIQTGECSLTSSSDAESGLGVIASLGSLFTSDNLNRKGDENDMISHETMKTNGRFDIPDIPLLLILQAIHRLVVLRGDQYLKVSDLTKEFEELTGVPLDITMLGDKDAYNFVAGFPDVFTTTSSPPMKDGKDETHSVFLCPIAKPDFRAVAERLARVTADDSLVKALKATAGRLGTNQKVGVADKTKVAAMTVKTPPVNASSVSDRKAMDEKVIDKLKCRPMLDGGRGKAFRNRFDDPGGDNNMPRRQRHERASSTFNSFNNLKKIVDRLIVDVDDLIRSYKHAATGFPPQPMSAGEHQPWRPTPEMRPRYHKEALTSLDYDRNNAQATMMKVCGGNVMPPGAHFQDDKIRDPHYGFAYNCDHQTFTPDNIGYAAPSGSTANIIPTSSADSRFMGGGNAAMLQPQISQTAPGGGGAFLGYVDANDSIINRLKNVLKKG